MGNEPTAAEEKYEKRSARAESTLSGGVRVAVEVDGSANAEQLAHKALGAAALRVSELVKPGTANRKKAAVISGIVGESAPMLELRHLLERIESSHATVVITGENGTGKELVARAVHNNSQRSGKRFVATNCSAFNENLLESELFGHKRGSFTGAVVDKPGLFEVADGGTFFLDEVGDMSPSMQVKLLRVLQEGTFMPVGATAPKKVDVRIIAATNRDLGTMLETGAFREDLYYRLHVVAVHVPPLRERVEDIPMLVDHFLNQLAVREHRKKVLTAEAYEKFATHSWPGNVRELENEIERVWVLSGDDAVVGVEYLSPAIMKSSAPGTGADKAEGRTMRPPDVPHSNLPTAVEALERQMITEGLRQARGNKTRAAEVLGISRRNLIRKVQSYGLEDSWQQSTDAEKGLM